MVTLWFFWAGGVHSGVRCCRGRGLAGRMSKGHLRWMKTAVFSITGFRQLTSGAQASWWGTHVWTSMELLFWADSTRPPCQPLPLPSAL